MATDIAMLPSTSSSGPSTSALPQSEPRQLPISLFTRHPALSIPSSTYQLPSTWKRFQLSELINKVLRNIPEEGRRPIPFDFLIDGEVLRGSLGAWARRNRGGDEEGVIRVEYVRSMLPPEEAGRRECEDWVSGLSLARQGHILVSSYLSHLQVLPLATASTSAPLYTLPLPSLLGATCGTWLSPASATSDLLVAAGGVDRSTHVFSLPSLSPDIAASSSSTARELYTLMGHTAPISSISASSSGTELASGSWDGNVHLYSIPETEQAGEEEGHQVSAEPASFLPGQRKRRKLERKERKTDGETDKAIEGLNDGEVGDGGWRRAPVLAMRGHRGRVGAVRWDHSDSNRIWSAGWDGSLRGWDAQTGANEIIRQAPSDKSFLSLSQFNTTSLLAAGAMDRTISLFDPRLTSSSLIALSLPAGSPVPSLACHPNSGFSLAAATYGGTVQIWDIRSAKSAMYSVRKQASGPAADEREVSKNGKRFGERLLAVDWDGETVVAGGEDGEVGIWRATGA